MEQEVAIYSDSPQAALFISLISGRSVYTVPFFSEYEDQIYKECMEEIQNIEDIQEALIYCFLMEKSDQEKIKYEEFGHFVEEVELTLYRYIPR